MEFNFVPKTPSCDKFEKLAVAIEDDLEYIAKRASMLNDALTVFAQGVEAQEGNEVFEQIIGSFNNRSVYLTELPSDDLLIASLAIADELLELGNECGKLSRTVLKYLL